MRASRPIVERVHPKLIRLCLVPNRASLIFSLLLLSLILFLPGRASSAAVESPAAALGPHVVGADYTLSASQFQTPKSDTREKSFKGNLVIPAGSNDASFTSDPTKAPIAFTDVAPHWWVNTPSGTSASVEIRTSQEGQSWSDWAVIDTEDTIMPEDSITETFGSMISVDQTVRTNQFVQARVTLHTDRPSITPVFHELTYSFIDAGVTPNPPRPQLMAQSNPSDVPMPPIVSRNDWGSPQGESSPDWTPRYKRVTHIIIHHTATTNKDIDFAARVRAIWYFHTYTRGWGDIGYNYLIDPNGVIYEGRAGGEDVEAGHAYPFNGGSMGIGMIGDFMTVPPSAAAQAALTDLIAWKVNERGIDPLAVTPITGYTDCGGTVTYVRPTIAGHRDYKGTACGQAFNDSTCPGDRLWDMLPQIRASIITQQPALRAVFTRHDTPGSMEPGASTDVHLTIRNSGSQTWPAQGQGAVSLGYTWLAADGTKVGGTGEDATIPLPDDVAFADSITLTVKLVAPAAAGKYGLVWDMYQDGQGWFADQGSRPLRIDVVVGNGTGDKAAPHSSVLPLPVYSSNTEVIVRWAGQDDPRGSGIASYDVQVRIAPNGLWKDWQTGTAQSEATFEGEDGYTYEFRSRARDAAGNVQDWPDAAEAYTTIDTRPPALAVDSPASGEYVQPGRLTITGHTEPGAFVTVNDRRAVEQSGVFTATLRVEGRDFMIHVMAADAAGNVSRQDLVIQAAPRYSDVQISDPSFAAIEALSTRGVVSGYPDGSFRPSGHVTRAQLAKMVVAARQWGLIQPLEGRFTDISPDSWQFAYVETAVARGIMQGYADGTFEPNDQATRADVVRALVIAAGWNLVSLQEGSFVDVPVNHWAAPYIATALSKSLIAPDDSGRFYPDSAATRADAAVMLYNMLKTPGGGAPGQSAPEAGTHH